LGANHSHDGRIGGVDMGIRRTCARRRIRASNVKGGLFLAEKGNSVVSAVMNIALATLITLSSVTVVFSAYYGLIIRDAVITAASRAGKAESVNQYPYLLQMLKNSLPSLANYEADIVQEGDFMRVNVTAKLPGFGFIEPPPINYSALAARETVG
jgi:hypothetical protein|tara:strand:- start:85 stop:549 length:465 start_codon:yes stop_codon:yes gene_type:complete